MNELLLYGGIVIVCVSVAAGIVVSTVLWVKRRRLNAKFDNEYGKLK